MARWISHRPRVSFQCNLCGAKNRILEKNLGRESSSCRNCRSSVRARTILAAISHEVFGRHILASQFPIRKDITALGLSDWGPLARLLAEKFDYTNTFYHREPKLDIQKPPAKALGLADFVTASDVFEHVDPPVDRAFQNLRSLLRPSGFVVFSVPYTQQPDTTEHFPELHSYSIERRGLRRIVLNRTADGRIQEFQNLIFHGGKGDALEKRVFAYVDLEARVQRAGFRRPRLLAQSLPEWGIQWQSPFSIPMILRPA